MKNLNFLSNLCGLRRASQSSDVGYDCRSTVVRPSFDCRSILLKLVSVLVLILTIGIGNVWGADVTYELTISGADFNTTSYAANNNEKTTKAVCTTDATKKMDVSWTSYQVMKNSTNMQWQKSKGYIYNSTDLGTINSVTITKSAGSFTTYYGTSEQPSSGSAGSGKGYFKTSVGGATGTTSRIVINFTISEGGGTPTCATPTFSPAAGSYIGTQSVTISSSTTGSTIYYTTDGTTPTTSSSSGSAGAASATVSVSSSKTLKAYAVKAGSNDSEVATATYTIVSCDHDDFDWNLATNSYDASPTATLISWTGTYATMQNSQGSGTSVINYIPPTQSSTRFYNNNTLTITPASGVTISHVVFTATTDGYATALRNSTWTNAAASGSGSYVIVTPTDGTSAFSAAVGGTCGFTNVNVCYSAASCGSAPTVSNGSLKGSVSSTSVEVQCTGGITNIGGAGCSLTSYGFAVGTSSNPTIGGTLTGTGKTYEVGSSIAVSTGFDKVIDGLAASTTYHVRSYATNGAGTNYGADFTITTSAACTAAPTVTAGSKGTITSTTAAVTCASGISSLGTGGCTISSYGFAVGTSSNPTIGGTLTTGGKTYEVGSTYTTTGTSFNTTVTGLTEGTLYYARPYATNGYDTGYGTQVSFGTPKITVSETARNFGNRAIGGSYEMTFTVEGVYLQGNISIAKSGTNQAMFSIDNATVTQTSGTAPTTTITVTYSPSTAGSHSATLTLSSTNATNKTVSLSGTGKYKVTWMAGDQEFNSQIGDADVALTNPGTPAPATYCPGGKVFVGWTATPIVGTTNTQPSDLFTDATKKTMPSGGATYYAVFATSSGTPSTSYAAITSGLASGNYVIAYEYNNNGTRIVLQNANDGSSPTTRLEGYALSLTNSKYSNPDAAYIWQLQAQNDGSYYIYNLAAGQYVNATTSALQLSSTPTKFTITYDGTNSRWTIVIQNNTSYYMHGYTGSYTDFRISTSGSDSKYRIYLYKNEGTQTFSAYATTCASDPTLSVDPSSLNFGNVASGTYKEMTFSLSGTNLTANASIAVSGTNSSYFSVTPSSVSKGSGTISATNITVRYTPGAVGDGHTATVTVSSTGADAKTVTLTGNCKASYSVSKSAMTNGDVSIDKTTNVMAGETVTLTITPSSGYVLSSITANGGAVTLYGSDNTRTFTMPAGNVTIAATFMERVDFVLVKNVNDLYEGATVVFCNKGEEEEYARVIGAYNSGNNWPAVSASVFEENSQLKILTTTPNMQTLTLGDGTAANSWSFYDGTGYVYAASSSSNYMKRQADLNDNGSFTITINTTTGEATLTAQGSNTRNTMSYNTSGFFSCYASDNTQSPMYIYMIPSNCEKLAAPTGLAAASITQTSCTLSWNSVTNASGYEISLDNGSSWTSTSTNTSYNATGLTAGTTYNWKVRATGTGDYCAKGNAAASTVTMKNAVTVTYNANGGSGTLPVAGGVVNLTEGDSYTVLGNIGSGGGAVLTKDGYTWAGWHNSTTYNATPAYTVGNPIIVNSNTTLYANWAPKRDTYVDGVHSNAEQYGDGADYEVPSCSDESQASSGACEVTHYKFIGWALEDADLTDPANIFKGGTKTATGATYYAVWGEEL